MADCVSLLDEELSSFVFNYLTENSRSPYGEEEVCSDRLDTDFPDFDLSQLDSDFDSVNCLSELHWCNDHSDSSPASIQYSSGDTELFETEEENAALLAALTDSLDGIVEDGVGGLSVFPSLGEDPEEEEDEEDELFLESEPVQGSLSPETEDPSLLKKLLLSPPNVPVGLDSNRLSSALSKTQQLKSARPFLKRDRAYTVERKPRAFRPVGHLCTELQRHLTQEANTEDTHAADTEEEEEEEEDEDSDSEDEEGEDEGEEESSSSSEVESTMCAEPLEPQFPSEKERHSVVELIRYMHTYCVPSRKQASWDRKERENVTRKTKPENPAIPRNATSSCSKPATHPATLSNSSTSRGTKPKIPFVRRRETKAHSLLKELLEAVASFDVSKPYRLHSPPYSHSRTTAARPKAEHKDTSVIEGSQVAAKRSKWPEIDEGSFSVRRSRRLASFPSRFAKRARSSGHSSEEESSVHHPAMDSPAEDSIEKADSLKSPETPNLCCNDEKRACLCLPLTPKSTGDPSRPFEQNLCVELCGTAGLTPPTTPPHKPVEEELFKPEVKAELPSKGMCPVRTHLRKLPEQTELYAQLRRMGPTGEIQSKGAYRDHDYCMLNLGESHKRIAAILPVPVCYTKVQEEEEDQMGEKNRQEETEAQQADLPPDFSPHQPAETGQPSPASSPTPEADAECPDSCRPPSPCHQINLSCESHCDKQSNITTHGQEEDGDKCQVLYIHNLPISVTQAVLRKRFKAFGEPEDCRVLVKKEERCGVITFRQNQNEPSLKHRRHDSVGQYAGNGSRRFSRKRYIDLDEAGPGPVKSKYDALDFDTLLKEAQRSLHR
ncbi:peroxisome proliferator-activated receptor gamma coactivator 1-beta isoform X2 [Ictalurus furcatus]|uniref:peroxisome proliferator-activated receptor gamma coactivator 1-beta isoform X2 n=1 Tax=Ictalurus furcatus TaxID=66913 RepID=UPI00234FF4D1|nr:peroxisome proliferator-activated receptor gamma coactivator 1-beta isoform X2 [Ictalurus furcatus]